MLNKIILNTHRGTPFVFINDKDAKGITNGQEWKEALGPFARDPGEIVWQR